jgi:hypothetical protein
MQRRVLVPAASDVVVLHVADVLAPVNGQWK